MWSQGLGVVINSLAVDLESTDEKTRFKQTELIDAEETGVSVMPRRKTHKLLHMPYSEEMSSVSMLYCC